MLGERCAAVTLGSREVGEKRSTSTLGVGGGRRVGPLEEVGESLHAGGS